MSGHQWLSVQTFTLPAPPLKGQRPPYCPREGGFFPALRPTVRCCPLAAGVAGGIIAAFRRELVLWFCGRRREEDETDAVGLNGAWRSNASHTPAGMTARGAPQRERAVGTEGGFAVFS